MKPRITLLTLGVDDLPRAVAFYRDGLAASSAKNSRTARSLFSTWRAD
jgi:catechol 2,3-dioxygenase-like lactoylglutathione lyase family enzyme